MRRRRSILIGILTVGIIVSVISSLSAIFLQQTTMQTKPDSSLVAGESALSALEQLPVKGRAPKTGYSRDQFGGDWAKVLG